MWGRRSFTLKVYPSSISAEELIVMPSIYLIDVNIHIFLVFYLDTFVGIDNQKLFNYSFYQ